MDDLEKANELTLISNRLRALESQIKNIPKSEEIAILQENITRLELQIRIIQRPITIPTSITLFSTSGNVIQGGNVIPLPEPTIMYPYSHYPLPLPTDIDDYYIIYEVIYSKRNYLCGIIKVLIPIIVWICAILASVFPQNDNIWPAFQVMIWFFAIFATAITNLNRIRNGGFCPVYSNDEEIGWSKLHPPHRLAAPGLFLDGTPNLNSYILMSDGTEYRVYHVM